MVVVVAVRVLTVCAHADCLQRGILLYVIDP